MRLAGPGPKPFISERLLQDVSKLAKEKQLEALRAWCV
jgi:hypothetical protein